MKYYLLINQKHYLIYGEKTQKIILAEFNIFNKKNDFAINVNIENVCGLNYLVFESEKIENIIDKIAELSFFLGIFEEKNGLFKPLSYNENNFVNPNISSILKYSGKTNEVFTKMMLNIGSNIIEKKENISILDPIAGKGTTLYEGLVKGYNCYGIEIAPKVVEESAVFLKKFLENDKIKFSTKKEKFSGENKKFKAEKFIFEINKNKESKEYKHFEIVSCNTIFADKIFKKNFFDIIIGDLPYGVKHSNITNEKQNAMTRSPKELLEASLDAWKNVLNENGVIIISWNTFLLKRKEFEQILENKGLQVVKDENLLSFEHRVDQAINRDFIVAKK